MSKIPMLEKFAAQSLVEHDGELIFSKEKFAELIVRECIDTLDKEVYLATREDGEQSHIDVILLEHFGVE